MTPRSVSAAVALSLAAALTACSSSTSPAPSTSTSAPSSSTSQSSTSTSGVVIPSGVPTASPSATVENDDGSDQTPGAPLVLDDAAKASALATGTKVMHLFARRNAPAATWWSDLVPLLTAQAQQAYQGTDPRNVPPTKITGEAKLTPASKAQVARVSVPTDVGVYLVILARTPDQPTWLADRIMPPENLGEQ